MCASGWITTVSTPTKPTKPTEIWGLSPADLGSTSTALAGANTALFAVVLTLVALIPTLFELARSRATSYVAGEETARRLRGDLAWLSYTIWAFAAMTAVSLFGILKPWFWLVAIVIVVFCGTLVVVAAASFRIAAITRQLVASGDNRRPPERLPNAVGDHIARWFSGVRRHQKRCYVAAQ
jgi:Ca2+/Na+ antiporter